MASNLYPLVFKPGIKRDGSLFQSEFCTSGQWIRFYRGMVRKIGGMQALNYPGYTNVNSILIYYGIANKETFTYLFTGNDVGVSYVTINQDTFNTTIPAPLPIPNFNVTQNANRLWQIIPAKGSIDNVLQQCIVCFGGTNLKSILDPTDATIRIITIGGDNTLNTTEIGDLIGINGGALFIAPRLFLYGENGLVRWSNDNNITTFTDSNSINISTDKVIFGAAIRGGINSPTLLFWTLSSVIRLLNSPSATAPTDLGFKIDVLSRDSSILSSRCVIEYDGIFYWPGTNRFFVYNGVVLPLENIMNRRYFFDNVDMNFRQNVFGVKNVAYGEIWWFYPEKMGAPNRPNVPEGINTRAIIYNLEENSWYDTQIYRDCGYADNVMGIMYTMGSSLTNRTNTKYFWKHEVGVNEVASFNTPINSDFTTPTISWAAFNPMKQFTGIDRWMDIRRIEPDFLYALDVNGNSVLSTIYFQVYTQEYAQSPIVEYPLQPLFFTNTTAKLDTRVQGRHVTFNFSSANMFEMGHILISIGLGDER